MRFRLQRQRFPVRNQEVERRFRVEPPVARALARDQLCELARRLHAVTGKITSMPAAEVARRKAQKEAIFKKAERDEI